MDQAAQGVRMGMGRQLARARQANVGQQVPATHLDSCQARVAQHAHVAATASRHGGPQRREQPRGYRESVVQQRYLAIRRQHQAQPGTHPRDRVAQPVRCRQPGGPQQPGDVDKVPEHLAVVRRGALIVPAIGQHLDGELTAHRRSVPASSGSSPKKTASPASAFRFFTRWLPRTSVSRLRRRNPACAAARRGTPPPLGCP